MKKNILLVTAAVIFIVLAFITDFGLYILLSIIMAFVTWLLVKSGERKIGEVIVQVGTAMVILPLIFMLIVFMIQSQVHPEAIDQLASKTIDAMVLFVAEKLPFVILADVAGAIVGSIIGALRRE